ncbi:MAG: hypothetical protein LBD58_06380 [Treponema sp.]|nr:hypothetical protein [Treponema sp.]
MAYKNLLFEKNPQVLMPFPGGFFSQPYNQGRLIKGKGAVSSAALIRSGGWFRFSIWL